MSGRSCVACNAAEQRINMHIVKRRDRAQTQAQNHGPDPFGPPAVPAVALSQSHLATCDSFPSQAGHLEARPSMPSTTHIRTINKPGQKCFSSFSSLYLVFFGSFFFWFLACFGLLTALCFRVIVLTAVLVYVSLAPEFPSFLFSYIYIYIYFFWPKI